MEIDLFGNQIVQKNNLKDIFGICPFSTLKAYDGKWVAKKRNWINLGIKREVGRNTRTFHFEKFSNDGKVKGYDTLKDVSVFDPVLCEVMYKWFVPEGGKILDPFAGGSVRGIVASKLGYRYTGIDIREEQVMSNEEQAVKICEGNIMPTWIIGDANDELDNINDEFDAVFTCQPYVNLEKYSNANGDLSNMEYDDFIFSLESIFRKSAKKVKDGGFFIVVVGEVRDKNGFFYGFVPDTIKMVMRCKDMHYYNEAILEPSLASAPVRAVNNMKTKKLTKVHQNVLIFKKEK